MRNRKLYLFAVSLAFLTAPAHATGIVLFNNYEISGLIGAWEIDASANGYPVSDSFTLAEAATVSGAAFGAWLDPGDSVTGVDWSIGTTPYDTSDGAGDVTVNSSTFDFNNGDYDIDQVSFSIPDVALSAGTYYLTLSGAVSADSSLVGWDVNNAAGIVAYDGDYGDVSAGTECFDTMGISGSCASSFEVVGEESVTTPEPSAWALLGAGMVALAAVRRRRRGR